MARRPIPWPDDWPLYFNALTEACDMLEGPCSCGAWHQIDEFERTYSGVLLRYGVMPGKITPSAVRKWMARERFWVDDFGQLWCGPGNADDNLHYASFEGYMTVSPYHEIWVYRRTDLPDGAEQISKTEARRAVHRFWGETKLRD